eukprot:10468340-Alexandrium_andersonii.AAC.1
MQHCDRPWRQLHRRCQSRTLRLHRGVQCALAFASSPSAESLQTWKSTRTLQGLGLGLQMATLDTAQLQKGIETEFQAIEDFDVEEDVGVSHWTS